MKKKKIIIIITAVAVIALTATGITLASRENISPMSDDYLDPVPLPETIDPEYDVDIVEPILPGNIEADIPEAIDGYFSITGVIVSIEETDEGTTFEIIDEHDNPAFLITNADTEITYHWLVRRAAAVGDTVTGWYSADMPLMMIWPPQYPTARLDIQETD